MKAYIIKTDLEYDIRFSRPIWDSTEVTLSYYQRDKVLTCTIEEIQGIIRSILNDNKLLWDYDKW